MRDSASNARGVWKWGQLEFIADVASVRASCRPGVSVIICTRTESLPAAMLLMAWEEMRQVTLPARLALGVGEVAELGGAP
jgi:hypothetical protein